MWLQTWHNKTKYAAHNFSTVIRLISNPFTFRIPHQPCIKANYCKLLSDCRMPVCTCISFVHKRSYFLSAASQRGVHERAVSTIQYSDHYIRLHDVRHTFKHRNCWNFSAPKILKHQNDIVKNNLLKLTVKIFKEQKWPFKLPGWNRYRQAGLHFFGRHEGTKSVPS